MTDEQKVVKDIRDHIASMCAPDRLATSKAINAIMELEKTFGTIPLSLAIALIGARMAAGE